MRRWMVGTVDYRWAVGLLIVLALIDVMVITAFWNTPINVSNNATISDRPALAADTSGKLHLVWSDTAINYPGNSEILYRTSTDGGRTWTNEGSSNLSQSAERSIQPRFAVAGNNRRLAAWADNGDTYARLWSGSDWLAPVQLSANVTPTLQISAAINEDGVALVAWTEGYGSISGYSLATIPASRGFYRRWNGTSWGAAQPLAARLVSLRGNLAYLATEQGTLLRSDNAGQSWGSPINLPTSYRVPEDMQLDSTGSLHMAWLTNSALLAGSYDGARFSPPVMISSWVQIPASDANSERQAFSGAIRSLALAVNNLDQLGLIWAAPNLEGSTAAYRPQGVNGLGGNAGYRIMASQSLDGRTWSAPLMQGEPGGLPAITGVPGHSDFYGTWRSPGQTPDVFVAVNQRPEPRYVESFNNPARLFVKGADVFSGSVRLNNSNPLAWPLFGFSQNYGSLLRGQAGQRDLLMLDQCLTSFNTLTGATSDPGVDFCLPLISPPGSRMNFVDGLVQNGQVYLLGTVSIYDPVRFTFVTSPTLLVMDLATGIRRDYGRPDGLPDSPTFAPGAGLAVTPSGEAIYAVINNQLYRYTLASNSWSNLNQPARSVVIAGNGTLYIGDGQRLLSSPNGANFSERATDFSTRLLHIDRNGCVIGLENSRAVASFQPTGGTVNNSATALNTLRYLPSALSEGADGTIYFVTGPNGLGGTLTSYSCATNQLGNVRDLPNNRPSNQKGGIAFAADNRIWMVLNEQPPVNPGENPVFLDLVAYNPQPLRGEVVSAPIFSGSETTVWGTLNYSVTVPSGGGFAVDVLDMQGTVIRENVASGTRLADLPAAPVRLRARMQATTVAASPVLTGWELTWQLLERRTGRLEATAPLTLTTEDGAVSISFPAGAVQQATTISYTEQLSPSQNLGQLRFAGRSFTIIARKADGSVVNSFSAPFRLIITYSDAELAAAGITPEQLDLHFWNGSAWVSTNPVLDRPNRRLIATLDHLTEFVLVGRSRNSTYLPHVRR